MKSPLKATLISLTIILVIAIGAIVYFLVINANPEQPPGKDPEVQSVVRPNSHILDDGGEGTVTVVEFLDFECEACGAFYPIVEDLREKYAGEITYVIRYFPLPGHSNAKNAAIAAEAASQQGQLEGMYHRLFETQSEWGEARVSHAGLFRSFAEELGLDMSAYDAAVADPATLERVEMDFNDGRALGVESTPTFFLDGVKVELRYWDDLEKAIEAAVRSDR